MEEFELFERLPGGALSWRGLVPDLGSALVSVCLLADDTGHECRATDPGTGEVMLSRTPLPGGRRILQIAYSRILATRAHLLCRDGYDVTSVTGNQVAEFVLRTHPAYDLFVVGDAATEGVRLSMVRWLHEHYPATRIVALNRHGQVLDDLRYNAPDEPPSAWLPLVSQAMAQSRRDAQIG